MADYQSIYTGEEIDEAIGKAKESVSESYVENRLGTMQPYIGSNGNWFVWDANQQGFVDSGQPARGAQGPQGEQGPVGATGPQGPAGTSIESIKRTSGNGAPGTTDTYTITMTDDSTTTFSVYNGANGEGSGDFMADGSVPMTGALQMGGHKIVNVATPTAATDVARLQEVQSITAASLGAIPTTEKGAANGVATLGSDGKVPSGQLPELNYDPAGSAAGVQANLTAHVNDKNNPHQVTAAQVGAIPTTEKGAAGGVATLGSDGKLTAAQKPVYTAADVGAATKAVYTATLSTSWSGSGPYTQTVNISGITSDMVPVVDVVLSSSSSTAKNQLAAWGCVGKIVTNNGSITATCYDEKPTTSIPIQLLVVQ